LLAVGIIQTTSAMTTNPISSSSAASNNIRKITTKYRAGMYSIVAAIVVLVLGTTLSDSISIMPVFLIGMVAVACTGQVILDLKRHPHHRFPKF